MIKIEFEAANGADLRKEMLALLGLSNELNFKASADTDDLNIAVNRASTELESVVDAAKPEEAPKPEQTTRKRRSKAEIEAEAAALATGATEPVADSVDTSAAPEGPVTADQTGEDAAVTAEDLTKKCVELGRAGKRDAVLAVFETQFGGATISKKDGKPQLTADQYPAAMEALNAIA